jgi:glycine C-acetyltransferase
MLGRMKSHIAEELKQINDSGLYKAERIIISPQDAMITIQTGRKVLNLCANNYLGLADHPDVIRAARESYDKWGYGLSSVRFICGTQQVHKELERKSPNFSAQRTRFCIPAALTPIPAFSRHCSPPRML